MITKFSFFKTYAVSTTNLYKSYTALFCLLVIYFDTRVKIIEEQRKVKRSPVVFLLFDFYCTVLCETK